MTVRLVPQLVSACTVDVRSTDDLECMPDVTYSID